MINVAYNGFWRFDHNLILLEPWEIDNSQDGIGRNAFAYICWPHLAFLKDTLLSCIKERDDTFLQFYRYPGKGADTMSRDHVGAIILAFYINRDEEELKWILDNLPWRLSRKYTQTIDFWLWQKSLKHKKFRFWISQLFFILNILMFFVILPLNWLIRKILRVKQYEIKDLNFPTNSKKFKKWERWLSKLIYPHFALFLLVWQIKILPNCFLKTLLQKMLLIESKNFVLDHLLGKEMSEEDYNSFQPTTGFIWGASMDNLIETYMAPANDTEMKFNDLNQGMLDYLWFNTDKIIENSKNETFSRIKNGEQIIHY